jgi:uncharacterized protein (TIGR03546 family)
MPIKLIAKLIAAVNSNSRPGEVAAGIAFGLLAALQPGWTIFRAVIILKAFFLKVNFAAVLLFLFLFSLLSPLADGLLDTLGASILTLPALQGFFTGLYNLPLVPYTRFNNTVVMGALAAGIVLWLPLYFLGRFLVNRYRNSLRDRIAEHPLVKGFLRLPVVSTIAKIAGKAVSLSKTI